MTLANFDFLPKTSTQFTKIYEDWGSFHFSLVQKIFNWKKLWVRKRKKKILLSQTQKSRVLGNFFNNFLFLKALCFKYIIWVFYVIFMISSNILYNLCRKFFCIEWGSTSVRFKIMNQTNFYMQQARSWDM